MCTVIGDPIGHSLSPYLHNATYEACQLTEKFVFIACRVMSEELSAAITVLRALNVRGISVTIPHKTSILPFLDSVDPLARVIGAVNTVVNEDGHLKGYNTDVVGISAPLEARRALDGTKVAILGAGGAGRAAAAALSARGAKLHIFNRTKSTAEALTKEFGGRAFGIDELHPIPFCEVIVNTTSVGMTPNVNNSLISPELFRTGQLVFDLVYTPYETKLLMEAKSKGIETIPGLEMFLYQAAAQFEIYTGVKPNLDTMRNLLLEYFIRLRG